MRGKRLMSEYQYYEFRAVDRPLTKSQMNELRAYSSRARISADSFINEYNWGDFKGDPDQWMEKYFDALLKRLIKGDDTHVAAEFGHRALREIRGEGKSSTGSSTSGRRSVGDLVARSEAIQEQRRNREAEQQARAKAEHERAQASARKKHLESLAGKEGALWLEVDKLIATKTPRRYDEAVSLLKDLHDLAVLKGTDSEFERRMRGLFLEHSKKPSLIERFRKAKLPV
jgi:hypothetical protein